MTRTTAVATTLLACLASGCTSSRQRTGYDRDPLVQRHLMSDRDRHLADDGKSGSVLQSTSSTSQKPASYDQRTSADQAADANRGPSVFQPARLPTTRPEPGHDADYRCLTGQVVGKAGRPGQYYVRYARQGDDDRYGGELRLAYNPRLAMLRVGDEVRVEGRVIEGAGGEPSYQIETFTITNP